MNTNYIKKLHGALQSLDSINLNTLSNKEKEALCKMNRGAFSLVRYVLFTMRELDCDLGDMLDPKKQTVFRCICRELERKYGQQETRLEEKRCMRKFR